jgi:transposase
VARQAKAILQVDKLEAVANRGYVNGEEILACEQADICVTLPQADDIGRQVGGRFAKQDFVYLPDEDVYRCQPGSG